MVTIRMIIVLLVSHFVDSWLMVILLTVVLPYSSSWRL
jgi:hypothetical protein